MAIHLIYATSNPGKLGEVSRHLGLNGIKMETMGDFGGRDLDVEETGDSLGENAEIKVRAYLAELANKPELRGQRFLVVADDTGLEIDGLNGAPGIHVRRWRDKKTRMGDQEIIDYAIEQMRGLKGSDRGAQFHTILALGSLDEAGQIHHEIRFFSGKLRGTILEKPLPLRIEGFPFESLLYIDEWGMALGEARQLPDEEKIRLSNHRERAINALIKYLQQELK